MVMDAIASSVSNTVKAGLKKITELPNGAQLEGTTYELENSLNPVTDQIQNTKTEDRHDVISFELPFVGRRTIVHDPMVDKYGLESGIYRQYAEKPFSDDVTVTEGTYTVSAQDGTYDRIPNKES